MTTSRAAMAALLAILVSCSGALAGWSGRGNYEPDTTRDYVDGWIWKEPDWSSAKRQVYFNGFIGQCSFPCYQPYAALNPNVGAARTGTYTTLTVAHAFFGVWKDCNKDRYMGLAEQGLLEYRAELLIEPGVCARVSTPNPIPLDWFPSHNDGQWIREYLPFSYNTPGLVVKDANPWNINDNDARAWTDGGLPETPVTGYQCGINPQPRGTFQSTGGFVRYADCLFDYKFTDAFNQNASAADSLGAGQVTFSDSPRDQGASASPLNQRNPWGTDGEDSFVDAWDCGQPKLVSEQVAPNRYVNVSTPSTSPSVILSGSPSGTANATFSGFDECARTTSNDDGGLVWGVIIGGKFHPGHTAANFPYSPGYLVGEADYVPAPAKASTAVMGPVGVPFQSNRPYPPASAVLGPATPPDLGVRPFSGEGLWMGGGIGSDNILVDPYSGTLSGPRYQTFYASVGAASMTKYSLILPRGLTAKGTYGAESCGTATTGIRNGWECDKSKWPGASDPTYPKVGSGYQLRDIDCYDGSVQPAREHGVGVGILSAKPCPYHVAPLLPLQ